MKIDVGGGITLTSAITVEAVDDLAIKQGDKVSAIVKSSDIIVGK